MDHPACSVTGLPARLMPVIAVDRPPVYDLVTVNGGV